MTNKFNLERSKILKISIRALIFLSGISILIWQVHGTFDTFIRNRTSFAASQDTFDSLVPPTIIFCSRNLKAGDVDTWFANVSNKHQFNKEFYWLNDKLYLFMDIMRSSSEYNSTLNLGENLDEEGNLLFRVEELMNPFIGLCYAIIPGKNIRLQIEDSIIFQAGFLPGLEKATVYFTSEEDRYGLLLSDLGRLMPFKVSLDAGVSVGVNLEKFVWHKLSSRGKCKPYSKGDSFMKCMLKHQIECFGAGNQTCKCIPENNHKTHLQK